jgi:hypothetical protein
MSSSNTKVVKLRDVYEEIAHTVERSRIWFSEAVESDFYSFSHPGFAWPIDRHFFEAVMFHLGDGLPFWFERRSGEPFKRHDWPGINVIGPNIEARSLGQLKPRAKGVWIGDSMENKMLIRVPHK